MRDVDKVGVATLASGMRSLVRGKTMAKDSLGLVLLQRGSGFFDDRVSITRSEIFELVFPATIFVEDTARYWPEINKSRPRIRAALD